MRINHINNLYESMFDNENETLDVYVKVYEWIVDIDILTTKYP